MIENGSRAATPPTRWVGAPENVAAGRREVIGRATLIGVVEVEAYDPATAGQAA
jgi:hypothetical protein